MALSPYISSLVSILVLATGPRLVQSLSMEYCASFNTGSTPTNSSMYQSNGLCHDFCADKSFAFAVLQQFNCWCSDYVPAKSSQVDTGECNKICPGYKYESCGGDDLYGYIALGVQPSGTAGETSASETPTSTSKAGQSTTTSEETTSTTTSVDDSPTTSSSSASSPTSSPQTTEETTSATKNVPVITAEPTHSIRTVTADGSVSLETVTVIPTPAAGVGSGADTSGSKSTGPTAGAIAGIVIGVLGVIAILAGLAVFFYLQRKKQQREEELNSRPHSHLSGSVGVMSTPTTAMASVWDGDTSTGRRSSRLMPHDPRMDPFAVNIYSRFENKSRESINTLQDNQDYSRRVLRTTNPDPDN
ncbi:hypothetical protein F4808DRAFT_469420 [Astrocystis sublimbata]|nr:hypothetical protein F4808DRAFT_469420 [Astrocystis sublimbata]